MMDFLPMWLVVPVMLPGMMVSLRRVNPRSRMGNLVETWHHIHWMLAGAPRWATALWILTLAGAILTLPLGARAISHDPPGPARACSMFALYFAVTAVLTYRALAREKAA
ncbi:hypothetical protein GCM10009662_60170 [Catellatospora coxensis]|uniref:Uncharacterized protein n=2 Tax=Catellatospora coxensis TaxID=310354 RepID=A0A8J3KPZ0_9ACTN|nr:hypothetical protein Cco03nite_36570 [Catellatospora coxensis]